MRGTWGTPQPRRSGMQLLSQLLNRRRRYDDLSASIQEHD
jgi:hypothetical protein